MYLSEFIKVLAPDQQFKVLSPSGHCGGVIFKKAYYERENLSNYHKQELETEISTVHTSDDFNDVIFIWLKRQVYNNG